MLVTDQEKEKPVAKGPFKPGPWRNPLSWVLLLLGGGGIWLAKSLPPSFVDTTYREIIYAPILSFWTAIQRLFPFSISGALILFGIILFGLRFFELISSALSRGFLRRCFSALFRCLVILSILVHPFFLFWGWHYRGTGLTARLHLGEPNLHEMAVLVDRMRLGLKNSRDLGLNKKSGPIPKISKEVERSITELGMYSLPLPEKVKQPPIPGMLLFSGTLGIVSPFTLEAHVEPSLHWADLPFLEAHELAHLEGITSEGEANFVAWHALVTSKHPLHRYCGWLALASHMPSRIQKTLPGPVKKDLEEKYKRRVHGLSPIAEKLSQAVYDIYLKSQGIKGGMTDYDRMPRLAASWWVKKKH